MRSTVSRFPVRRPDVSTADKQKMTESLYRLSKDADSFITQAHIFTEKVAAVNDACKKALAIMERF